MTSEDLNKQIRADLGFIEELDDIINKRIKNGKEDFKHPITRTRVTMALRRHPSFPFIKEDIINNDLGELTKGGIQ